jgi:uncharacterized protein with von Willebrand factor type A (vWA) domain
MKYSILLIEDNLSICKSIKNTLENDQFNGIHNAFYLLSQSSSIKEQKKYIQIAQTSLEFLTSIVNYKFFQTQCIIHKHEKAYVEV